MQNCIFCTSARTPACHPANLSLQARPAKEGEYGATHGRLRPQFRRHPGLFSAQAQGVTVTSRSIATGAGPSDTPPEAPISGFSVRPFLQLARLDKPIGTWLLYWPCAWSITLASQYVDAPVSVAASNILLFGVGAVVMRGAGCTINDMWDAKMDRLVERTKSRPIASGQVSHFQALVFLGAQLSTGLAVLVNLNTYSILLGASSLSLVTIYPLMKRITYWPQFVLGLAFNWGTLLGWSAVAGSCNWPILLPMYAGSVAWTLVYDTIYAHQDKVDDVTAGVKSTALLFSEQTKPILSAFSTIFLSSMAFSLLFQMAVLSEHPAFFAALGAAGAQLAWQVGTANLDSRADCWRKFVSNQYLGLLIWLGLAVDYGLHIWKLQGEEAMEGHVEDSIKGRPRLV
ncbi:4-hydroxybenzoate polyprenyl transferase [Tilletiaria anomala UBC 951]|uniref:4-hydroxybenzoate polyprenyltransferase, mitochondrial n=1 Tax=Tilletiaria anomala (strain ATCC 24038 / CBS 436.72 / UBC 951) TaxID=1037660 RepID=A0A066VMM8_TILAU|nr:4-hydroxybenzoate polyprenyl transferase [Tilletiaria anomala UBC 951]KDN42736.1 4-hydroxybenzoate polyprenyl transferase [Tilletiaria anomala UBC 951]